MMKLYTQNGHALMEVISALQKCIRRGDEQQALFWALELCPKFERYLWRRLVIIVNEDIGIANPTALILIPSLKKTWEEMRENGTGGFGLLLSNAILYMCRSPKTRLADYFMCAVEQEKLQKILNYDIPDYALDKHTGKGRALGRGLQHWHDEGCQLSPESDDPITTDNGNYEERALKMWSGPLVGQDWPKWGPGKGTQINMFGDDKSPEMEDA